jgi:hypothetical protein
MRRNAVFYLISIHKKKSVFHIWFHNTKEEAHEHAHHFYGRRLLGVVGSGRVF